MLILRVSRIREAQQKQLAEHLKTVHPTVDFYTATITRVLDHFVVQQETPQSSE